MTVPDDLESRLIGKIEAMAATKGLTQHPVLPETTFDSLQMDSLDKINLSFEVEEAFAIEIPDAAIGTIRTVGDMVDGVRALIAAKPA